MSNERPPWLIPAIGAGIFSVLFIGGILTVALWTRHVANESLDPVARAALAREILHGEMPRGLAPAFAARVPGDLVNVLVLSDAPNDAKGRPTFNQEGVWLMSTVGGGTKGIHGFLSDAAHESAAEGPVLRMEQSEDLGRAELTLDQVTVSTARTRGLLHLFNWTGEVTMTKFGFVCPSQARIVLGAYFVGRSTEPGRLLEELVAPAQLCRE